MSKIEQYLEMVDRRQRLSDEQDADRLDSEMDDLWLSMSKAEHLELNEKLEIPR